MMLQAFHGFGRLPDQAAGPYRATYLKTTMQELYAKNTADVILGWYLASFKVPVL